MLVDDRTPSRLGLGALAIAFATSCGSGTMTPRERWLDETLDAAGDRALPDGTRVKKITGRAIRGELEEGFIVMLKAPTCYTLVGVGEPSLRTMSVLVTNPTGSWVARTKEPSASPVVRLCAKLSGPYRVAVTLTGRGDYALGVYTAEDQPLASASAVASVAPPPRQACDAIGDSTPFHRRVDGPHRGCASDTDCISVKLDCGPLMCTGVHKQHRAGYSAPLDCRGYTGELAKQDCDPQFGVEAPRCRDGCCVSERIAP